MIPHSSPDSLVFDTAFNLGTLPINTLADRALALLVDPSRGPRSVTRAGRVGLVGNSQLGTDGSRQCVPRRCTGGSARLTHTQTGVSGPNPRINGIHEYEVRAYTLRAHKHTQHKTHERDHGPDGHTIGGMSGSAKALSRRQRSVRLVHCLAGVGRWERVTDMRIGRR